MTRTRAAHVPAHHPIALYLEATGTTARSFAERLGVSESRLSLILAGKRPITLELAVRIEEFAGIPCKYLAAWQAARRAK